MAVVEANGRLDGKFRVPTLEGATIGGARMDLIQWCRDSRLVRRLGVVIFFMVLAWAQIDWAVKDKPEGEWFLYGRDTVSHDLPVQMWIAREVMRSGGEMPLWMPPLHGGLPTLGAWLWTPLAPSIWAYEVMPTPQAQRFQWWWALWWAGLGGYVLGRAMGLSRCAALLVGVGCGVSGHVVTLIHAGHLQKVLALAWLPWCAAGGLGAMGSGRGGRVEMRWACLGGFALGMMFLSGHPQIAYVGAHVLGVMALLGGGWDWVSLRWRGMMLAGMVVLGGLMGSAQLLPGMEMGGLSNRAGGVEYDEAVATSYPASELGEFFLPRHRGDSSAAGFGQYDGAWGERLVSDYAGVVVCALALVGIAIGRDRRRLVWIAIALASVVVGLGANTPMYGLLHAWWPGMRSFRSPGTFFAGVALALPALAGVGLEALRHRMDVWRAGLGRTASMIAALVAAGGGVGLLLWPVDGFVLASLMRSAGVALLAGAAVVAAMSLTRERGLALAGLLALVTAGDLVMANRAFLVAAQWEPYAAYLGPTGIDIALMDEPRPLRVFEPGRELSLQQLLNERDALLGYHPVTYRAVQEQTDRLGFDSREWRAAWGVRHRVVASEADLLEGERIVAPVRGGLLAEDEGILPPVRGAAGGRVQRWEWLQRDANETKLFLRVDEPTTLLAKETTAPGWRHRVNDGPWIAADEVRPARQVELPAGESVIEWQYRPGSYRVGLFLTLVGVMIAVMGIGMRRG